MRASYLWPVSFNTIHQH